MDRRVGLPGGAGRLAAHRIGAERAGHRHRPEVRLLRAPRAPNGRPAPGAGNDRPAPGAGNVRPAPGAGNDQPASDAANDRLAPGAGNDRPASGAPNGSAGVRSGAGAGGAGGGAPCPACWAAAATGDSKARVARTISEDFNLLVTFQGIWGPRALREWDNRVGCRRGRQERAPSAFAPSPSAPRSWTGSPQYGPLRRRGLRRSPDPCRDTIRAGGGTARC